MVKVVLDDYNFFDYISSHLRPSDTDEYRIYSFRIP